MGVRYKRKIYHEWEEPIVSENNNGNITLTGVIAAAMKIPGIRVDREAFLRDQFKDEDPVALNHIVAVGPVAAGCDRDTIRKKAEISMLGTTLLSTGASFLTGLPGGLAMAVTIPADILQFYGAALKMAQEIAYLYGEEDLWKGEEPDEEKVNVQLVLYCGVMLGATGAAQTVRLRSSAMARQLMSRLPERPDTRNYSYPIVKSILTFFPKTLTKTSLAKGITKAIPILGGVVSGGITFAALRPMGIRLQQTFDKAHFSYSDIEIRNDLKEVEEESLRIEAEGTVTEAEPEEQLPEAAANAPAGTPAEAPRSAGNTVDLDGIRKAKELLDEGIIDENEFAEIKAKLIGK